MTATADAAVGYRVASLGAEGGVEQGAGGPVGDGQGVVAGEVTDVVEHHHRLGSCTGRLTLREGGVEYGSKSHGRWKWEFARIRGLDVDGSRRLALQTYEDDMLGLLDRKNYNFSVLGEALDPAFGKRYERLALRHLTETASP